MPKITNDWLTVLEQEFNAEYYLRLRAFLLQEYKEQTVFPPADDIFNAFHYTPLHKVKVLLLGQDPYHNVNQAHGLCFSVQTNQRKLPPSLINIYKELQTDLGCSIPNNGYLKNWADQGVLMLNTVLTVRAHEANSHKNQGWEVFTDKVIQELNKIDKPMVYFLWGSPAGAKRKMLNNKNHLVLQCPHPSPLSAHRGFFGSKHFSKANAFLVANGVEPINWQIDNI